MIDSSALLSDLKAQLRLLQADLKERADDPTTEWGATLQREHAEALRRERTGLSWTAWRDNEVDQAAVAWIVATTFIRFCEDNDLLVGATLDGMPVAVGWIAGPGDRTALARENQTAYFRVHTSHHDRDWLQQAFRVLAAQPAGVALVDPKHNPVWTAEISAEAAKGLVSFWRRTHDDGALVHDFTDPDLGTRFLGDLYQDLSEHAKKTYALLQTPEFVEEFILDRTLTPAIAEFGIDGLKLIDPTCGSGHFLLGAFQRLNAQWASEAPGLDPKQRVRKAMDSIHGVDLNPFAVAIARFRLTVAGLLAAGEKSLVGVPPLGFHLAIGDSLLGEQGGRLALFESDGTFAYGAEDLNEYAGILAPSKYHVVVGNPPYITVKDKVLSQKYRKAYATATGKYALSVPFMELFFRLAIKGIPGRGSGRIGKITSNSFMKREFGKKLIEEFFAGFHESNPVDLTCVIDSQGVWMPGHNFDGTPTCIIFGRRRRPVDSRVRVIVSLNDDPGKRPDPENGPVWTEMLEHLDDPGFSGRYIAVSDTLRDSLLSHPWTLGGGGLGEVLAALESGGAQPLESLLAADIGFASFAGNDEPFFLNAAWFRRNPDSRAYGKPLAAGGVVRDWMFQEGEFALAPYDHKHRPVPLDLKTSWGRHLWRFRTVLQGTTGYDGVTQGDAGADWWTWYRWVRERYQAEYSIAFAFNATHNHFVLSQGGWVFTRSAPVITLSNESVDAGRAVLGLLNSSTTAFWLRQVSQKKGGDADTPWLRTWEFTGTKLKRLPLPAALPVRRGKELDSLAQAMASVAPRQVLDKWLASGQKTDLAEALESARIEWGRLRARCIFEQEELDWEVYQHYGLLEESLAYSGTWAQELRQIDAGERAFAIAMARDEHADPAYTTWFDYVDPRSKQVHGHNRVKRVPDTWPGDYSALVWRRLALIREDPRIAVLETPEHKRRWAVVPWELQCLRALESAILDRLEDYSIWRDAQGPIARTVAQLVDMMRHDGVLLELSRMLAGSLEPDLTSVIQSLMLKEAVPYLSALRLKGAGMEKFREWQVMWDLQRRQDDGERHSVAMPPRYELKDFVKPTYWTLRGSLDVPKERFVLYPGVGREGDTSPVLGWAGWNHRDQAVALVREILTQQALGASDDALVPMVAGLVELEPWLHQWHTDLEPEFGSSAARAVTSQIDQLLTQLQMTRDDVNAWRPPAATRGRPRRA